MRLLVPAAAVCAYLLAVAGLHPQALSFDALSFLIGARAGTIDYGHALYLPLLGAARALAGESLAPERSAQLVSALGAALTFALLWRRVERAGAERTFAALIAACFGLSTLVWQEAGSIEPTTWTLGMLLLAAEASGAYGRRPTWSRLSVAVLAFGAAVGFHLVSLCALPWLVACCSSARRAVTRAPIPKAQLFVSLGCLLVVMLLAVEGGELGSYLSYWSGFVPDYREGLWTELASHLRRGGRLFLEGAPVLLLAAAGATLLLARERSRCLLEGALLGSPYLCAFVVLGKPLVGLLAPVLLAAALVLGCAAVRPRWSRRTSALLLALAATSQLALSLPQALEWWRLPDPLRRRAELFSRYLPAGAVLFAGPVANHVRYYFPGVEVVSLPELWHRSHARDRSADPIEVVRAAVSGAGRACVLSSDGAGFLEGGLSADLTRLGLSVGGAFLIPEDPSLALFLLGE